MQITYYPQIQMVLEEPHPECTALYVFDVFCSITQD